MTVFSTEKKDLAWALHVARNPWGWCEDDVREARLMVCDRLELTQKQLAQEQATTAALEARVKWLNEFFRLDKTLQHLKPHIVINTEEDHRCT